MIALLHDGRIVASGTASELKRLVPGGLVEVTFQDERQLKRAFSLLQERYNVCLLYTSPSPRDRTRSRMPSSA